MCAFSQENKKMQLIKHAPFHKNAYILCKLDENTWIFLHFHENVHISKKKKFSEGYLQVRYFLSNNLVNDPLN